MFSAATGAGDLRKKPKVRVCPVYESWAEVDDEFVEYSGADAWATGAIFRRMVDAGVCARLEGGFPVSRISEKIVRKFAERAERAEKGGGAGGGE